MILKTKIAITAVASISPLGHEPQSIWKNYENSRHCFSERNFEKNGSLVAGLDEKSRQVIFDLKQSDPKYKSLDNSVLYAIAASRAAVKTAGWQTSDSFGINLGSSRGATELFEKHFTEFLQTGTAPTLSSPTTTLGNIASWVSHDLQSRGPEISHSITCSTALHALLNGIAWLGSGMADKFLVGGSEAPLTDFTIAQMQAMKIYATENGEYPCRAFDLEKKRNTMILGEGAAVCCLETGTRDNALAYVEGIGYATEILAHNVSISAEADCFQQSMKMALQDTPLSEVDAIVMHAPGTIKGDLSEYRAIRKIFADNLPMLTNNKWKIGHTLGASGMLSIELALMMLAHQTFVAVPFAKATKPKNQIAKILVNAVGFGGNAVSILLSRP